MDGVAGLAMGLRFIIPLALQSTFYGFDYAAQEAAHRWTCVRYNIMLCRFLLLVSDVHGAAGGVLPYDCAVYFSIHSWMG